MSLKSICSDIISLFAPRGEKPTDYTLLEQNNSVILVLNGDNGTITFSKKINKDKTECPNTHRKYECEYYIIEKQPHSLINHFGLAPSISPQKVKFHKGNKVRFNENTDHVSLCLLEKLIPLKQNAILPIIEQNFKSQCHFDRACVSQDGGRSLDLLVEHISKMGSPSEEYKKGKPTFIL